MRTQDFDFHLPEHLIASYPLSDRASSRLLVVKPDPAPFEHHGFSSIIDQFLPGDVLVMNNTRVMNARLFGRKESGGKIECLLERVIDERHAVAHIRASKSPKAGSRIALGDGFDEADADINGSSTVHAQVVYVDNGLYTLELAGGSWFEVMDRCGHVPLPPYMQRDDEASDLERYQTVYAKELGAVAAPTAGLHFTPDLLEQIRAKGVQVLEITLHVGAGTFQPVRVDNVADHRMHSEWLCVNEAVVEAINHAKAQGRRVIAVGTTSVRSLETAAMQGKVASDERDDATEVLQPFSGESDIFIYPGFQFKVVDAMITNFHLPQSTLLMLVSAFSGQQRMLEAYEAAIAEEYRFYSYGDAMWLERATA